MKKRKLLLFFLLLIFTSLFIYGQDLPVENNQNQTSSTSSDALKEAQNKIIGLLNDIYNFIIRLALILGILKIIWGGIVYLFSIGDITNQQEAKNTIVDAILGMIIVLTFVSFKKLLESEPTTTQTQ